MKELKFVNAQEMAKQHPETFEATSLQKLEEIKVGYSVKVATCGERFWITVIDVKDNNIIRSIDNDLVNSNLHGLHYDDVITVEKDNVFQILE